jgi:hypothetical protein
MLLSEVTAQSARSLIRHNFGGPFPDLQHGDHQKGWNEMMGMSSACLSCGSQLSRI